MKQAIKIGSYIFNLVDTCSLDINKHYKKRLEINERE